MKRSFELKIYKRDGFEIVSLSNEMFPSNIMKENAKTARAYLEEYYPSWTKAVLVETVLCYRGHVNTYRISIAR